MGSRYADEGRAKSKRPDDEHKHRRRHRSSSDSDSPERSRRHSRSRSRSSTPDRETRRHHRDKAYKGESSTGRDKRPTSNDVSEPVCPPPPIISRSNVAMSFAKPAKPVQLKLAGSKPIEAPKKMSVASAFSNNSDEDDDDDDEPPPMKYSRNIGRETPTSSGPNSFGKTKQGFCDSKKIFERRLKEYKN